VDRRLDPRFYKSEFREVLQKLQNGKYPLKKLDSIAKIICGPFGSAIKNENYKKQGIPLIRISNLKNDVVETKNIIFIEKELSEKLKNTQVKKDDLIISQRGTLGLVAIITDEFFKWNISANFIALKNIEAIPIFIKIFLNSKIGKNIFERQSTGQVQTKITTNDIKNFEIPLPPREIQNQIVTNFQKHQKNIDLFSIKINQLQRECEEFFNQELGLDQLKEKRELSFLSNIQNFNSKRLDPNYYQTKYQEAEEILNKGKYLLREIGKVLNVNQKLENMNQYEKIKYIDLSCVDENFGEVQKIKKFAKKDFPSRARQKIQKGDLLIASLKGSLKSIAIFKKEDKNIIASTGFFIIFQNSLQYNNIFFQTLFSNKIIQNIIEQKMTGAIMSAISRKEFLSIKIPFPPLNIQNKIASKIEKFKNQIDGLRGKIQQEQEKQDKVLDVLFD
jgi:restriction endonuclease S subunit